MKEIILCDDTDLLDVILLCQEYSLGIEVQSFYDPEYLEKEIDGLQKHIDAIKNVKSKSVHGPFADLCLGSSDKMIREVTRNRFEYAYDVAKKLKAQNLVLHHGYVPKTSYPPNWIKRSFTFFDDFFANKSNDIKIHLENVLEFDSDMLFEVIEGLQGKNIDVCLDIGHAHCNSKISVVEWIKRLKGKIGYVHMHDNNGFEDEHLGLGMGNIPLDEVCEVLEQYSPQAIWAIESKTDHIQKSIDWMMTRGYIK
ncbi:sugar phosphate isomerase/epimerase family protein [Lutispora saccharofermentans]|uniref:Sugar phosphate isomerase/epimerase n=1 Tax=Lutispora saccharofermentans TaxID=3024236 RepID=A0ABT1NFC6_9FIRM|nr:sugar phosphate isomerase/epimerase family protein [Lutispora saccharofermentans]MCQ1529933.1 sugar phosphate isomerase/epimerase [Lutispora saccharofermentans]